MVRYCCTLFNTRLLERLPETCLSSFQRGLVHQLDSVRELTDSSGVIQAAYSYTPFGQVTKTQGTLVSDFQYAGYFQHVQSGLSLTMRRAYNSGLGRWISRDPLFNANSNSYSYADNNPASKTDKLGLDPILPSNPFDISEYANDYAKEHYPNATNSQKWCFMNQMQHQLAGAFLTAVWHFSWTDAVEIGVLFEQYEVMRDYALAHNLPPISLPNAPQTSATYWANSLKQALSNAPVPPYGLPDTPTDILNDAAGASIGMRYKGNLQGAVNEIAHAAGCKCGLIPACQCK
jgi:RHS repeat-associated protein